MKRLLLALLAATFLGTLFGLQAGCQRNTESSTQAATSPAASSTQSSSASSASFKGTDITGVTWGRTLGLADPQGKTHQLQDFLGKVVVVFFGYTQCPDICPATMAMLRDAKAALGVDAAKVQVLFVTLDPERDSASVMEAYTKGFDPSFIGLRGDMTHTKAVAADFKVFFAKNFSNPHEDHQKDHEKQSPSSSPATMPATKQSQWNVCLVLGCAYAHGSKDHEGQYGIDHNALTYVYDPRGQLRLAWGQATPASDMTHDLKLLLAGK